MLYSLLSHCGYLSNGLKAQTCAVLYPYPFPCVSSIHSEDKGSFNTLVDAVKTNYNDRFDEIRKKWGGGVMGVKTQAAKAKLERLKQKEMAQKM